MFYYTTPIYYVNGDPHLGHAHTSVMADILKRYWKIRGGDAFMTTGTDEHGQKNEECAKTEGLPVDEFLDRQSAKFKALFERLNVDFDVFVRTSSESHKYAVSHALWLLENEFIKKDYTGLYCVGCEQFKKETDLTPAGECPDHHTKPVSRTETNYFFPLEPYREKLIAHIEVNPDWITPAQYRNEVLEMLKQPLEDLCISRPIERLTLGIPLPFDDQYVTYVWFDALLNYLSSIGWPDHTQAARWKQCNHLIGKDILKTHAVYWPCMLMALEVPLPKSIQVHAHWLGKGRRKMSKSLGNVVDPNAVADNLGVDALRYFLARRAPTTTDGEITEEFIEDLYNIDLANGVGNLLSRSAKLCQNTFGGFPEDNGRYDAIYYDVRGILSTRLERMEDIAHYTEEVAKATALVDQYFSAQAPWKLAKEGNLKDASRVLRSTIYCVKMILTHLQPILPDTAERGLKILGNELSRIPEGHIFDVGTGLFQRK